MKLTSVISLIIVSTLTAVISTATAQSTPATVRMSRYGDFFRVPISVNGHAIGMATVDTNATYTILDTEAVSKLQLQVIGSRKENFTGSLAEAPVCRADDITLGGCSLGHAIVELLDQHRARTVAMTGQNAVVGMDLLGTRPFMLDFRASTLVFDPPQPTGWTECAIREVGSKFLVKCTFGDATGWFFLDTSSDGAIYLLPNFSASHRDDLPLQHAYPENGDTAVSTTIISAGRFATVDALGRRFIGVRGYFHGEENEALSKNTSRTRAGYIGTPLLRDAQVLFDLPHRKLSVNWLKPESLDELLVRLNEQRNKDASPLIGAILLDRADAVEALLNRGENPNELDSVSRDPLIVASQSTSPDASRIVAALLKAGANPNGTAEAALKPLNCAALDGDINVLRQLVGAHAKIDARDYLKRTPLICAVLSNREDLATELLNAGASADVTASDGRSLLHIAATRANRRLLEKLAPNGAHINVTDERGATPLLVAASNTVGENVDCLLEMGADPNVGNRDGVTPLMAATYDPEIVRALLERGADLAKRDKENRTALDYALVAGKPRSIDLLLAHSASTQPSEKK